MTVYATITSAGTSEFDPGNGLSPVFSNFSTPYTLTTDATAVQSAAAAVGITITLTGAPLQAIWPGPSPSSLNPYVTLYNLIAAFIAGGGGGGGGTDPNAVHFTAQSLTAPQKAQALGNIGGASTGYVDARDIQGVKSVVTASTTMVANFVNPVDATAAVRTSTLPAASASSAGTPLIVMKTDTGANMVNVTGTVNGVSATIGLATSGEVLELFSDGSSSWWVGGAYKSLAGLDARYSTTGVAASNYTSLLQFYAALANRENASCDIIYGPGDSLGEGYPATSWERTPAGWAQQLMRQRFQLPSNPIPAMSAIGNDRGFVGVPGSAILGHPGNNPFPWTFTGGTNNSTSGWGAKFASWFGTAAGHKAQIAAPVGGLTSFDIHHIVGAGGGATGAYYKIGAAAAVVFSTTAGATATQVLHVATAVSAGTVIEIGYNGTGGVLLTGIREYSNTESASISVHNCCIGGAQASTWTTTHPSGGWPQGMAALNPDLIVMELGGNEFLNAIASSTFKTNALALIVLIRAAGMSCPIVMSLPYNGTPAVGGGEPLTAYVARAKEIAAADPTVIVLDNSVRMPATFATNTYGLYFTDNVHGAANGNAYALMAESLAATISPQ